jgi:adenylosuccinate lyase
LIDLEEIEFRQKNLKFRGAKGTTGTQASFLALFNNDHQKCASLNSALTRKFGFEQSYDVVGQTYPRKVDAQIAGSLAGIAASVHRFANDIRLLAGLKQVEEPFETEQVGSSAMAYKRNPMRCERATGLARFVMSLAASPLQTAAEQWFERTLDDSSNKRIAIPELFLAIDGCLIVLQNVAQGLVVYPRTIQAALAAELPFMATEEILMAAVRAGGDRQVVHEKIRAASVAASEAVKQRGEKNDLLERLKNDPDFASVDLSQVMDASKFIGRAAEQVEEFMQARIVPLRARYGNAVESGVELHI